jgi:hypothetical protein
VTVIFLLHLLFLVFNSLPLAPSLLILCFNVLLIRVMEGERSPVLEEVVGREAEVCRLEAAMTGSYSRDDSNDGLRDVTDAKGEESGAIDPCESARSYDFGASTLPSVTFSSWRL